MTRFTLAALAALVFLPSAHAQATFGFRAGLNVADVYGEEVLDDTSPRLGLAAGVFASFPVSPSVSIQPEVLYSMKGSRRQVGNADLTNAVDYIEVPLLVQYAAPVTSSGLMLGAYVGPYAAFKINESTEFDQNGGAGNIQNDLFAGTDFGAVGGLTVGAGPFALDGRYTLGLSDAYDNPIGDTNPRNGVFSITGVYRFGGY